MPEVETAVNAAADLINNDWPNIKAGIQKQQTRSERRTRSRSRRSHQIIETRRNKESDFFTQPVELQTNALYPIANNGSASTPFYTALSVGRAVLLSSVATTEYYLGKKDRNNFTKREQFVARMLTF